MKLRVLVLVAVMALAGWLVAYAPITESSSSGSVSDEQIEKLIKQLGDDSFDVREKATKALVEIGAPALPLLRKAAADTNADIEIRNRAKAIIDKIKTSPAAVRESLKDKDPKVRKEAAETIVEDPAKYKELLPVLVDMVKDKDEGVRDAVSVAIAAIDPENKAIAGSKVVKAMVSGKYGKLLRRIEVEQDKNSYAEFYDYGHYPATANYSGHENIPEGYWVYVYPHWYIWGSMKDKDK
jgi:HEAT repeat protein